LPLGPASDHGLVGLLQTHEGEPCGFIHPSGISEDLDHLPVLLPSQRIERMTRFLRSEEGGNDHERREERDERMRMAGHRASFIVRS
jgi:hypothetical protein